MRVYRTELPRTHLRSSSAGRVGGDPPKISFLAFGRKMGSGKGVKTSQIREKNHLVARQGGFLVGGAQFSNLAPLYAEIRTYFEQNG